MGACPRFLLGVLALLAGARIHAVQLGASLGKNGCVATYNPAENYFPVSLWANGTVNQAESSARNPLRCGRRCWACGGGGGGGGAAAAASP